MNAAGCTTGEVTIDDDKVDLVLRRHGPKNPHGVVSPVIDVQMKSTSLLNYKDDHLIYDLDVETHNHLADPARHLPALLLVVAIPKEPKNWVAASSTTLALSHQGLWFELSGQPQSSNRTRVRLKIPTKNLLTPEAVNSLLDRVKVGERALV